MSSTIQTKPSKSSGIQLPPRADAQSLRASFYFQAGAENWSFENQRFTSWFPASTAGFRQFSDRKLKTRSRDLYRRRVRAESRSRWVWSCPTASPNGHPQGRQRWLSIDDQQPDGNLRGHQRTRIVEAALQRHALQRFAVSGGRDNERVGREVEKERLVAQQQGASKEH